jgi:23S rRNA (cytosine1962-C5)-methyltransferase
MINGESEGFPGMVADRYGETLVVKLYTAAWLPRWEEMEGVLREVLNPRFLVLRMSRNIQDEAAQRWGLEEGFVGAVGDEVVVFRENGIHFEAAVRHGQKTGFFLDQRENRARVERLSEGREVLNVFSFSGGFSLYAARGGAKSVTDLDISGHALESAGRNFELNANDVRISQVSREGVQADAFRWMDEAGRSYDLIIVDPPSLAKRKKEREGAIRAYQRLNARAIGRLRRGGILVAASCSAHVAAAEFFDLVKEEAQRSGRRWRVLWSKGHAADHPVGFAEAEYLKAICLEFEGASEIPHAPSLQI